MLLSAIEVSKQKYYSRISKKLMDSGTSHKAYWSLPKTFLINKKIPCISPLSPNNKYISNFGTKLNYLTIFFLNSAFSSTNASEIFARLNIETTKTYSSIPITRAGIAKIIKSLDPNKDHRRDMISKRILDLCGNSVLPPSELTFKSCLESDTFSSEWKKANVVPVHKNGSNL